MAGRGHKADGFSSKSAWESPKNDPAYIQRPGLTVPDESAPIMPQIEKWVRTWKQPRAYLAHGISLAETCAFELEYYNRYGYAVITRHDSIGGTYEHFGRPECIRINRHDGTLEDFEIREAH